MDDIMENYDGSDLFSIKKRVENVQLKRNRDTNNLSTGKQDGKMQETFGGHSREFRGTFAVIKNKPQLRKRISYDKLVPSKKTQKRESLLHDADISRFSELTAVPESLPKIQKSQNVVQTTKIMFGLIASKKTESSIKELAKDYFRRTIKTVIKLLKCLNILTERTRRQQEQYLESVKALNENKNTADMYRSSRFSFDKSQFKVSKEIELTLEMQKILNIPPIQRTEEQIQSVIYSLSALSAFSEYPLHLKKKICTVAYYKKIDANRVIVRETHRAENFYFIITGTADVTITTKTVPRRINTLSAGCSFGELALLHHSRRTASVVSTSPMQLLAIERNDFYWVFMNNSEDSEFPEHISFLGQITVFKNLELKKLMNFSEACICHFYKNFSVICSDDIKSDWIYILKSGSASIIKEIRIPKEDQIFRENTLSLSDIGSQVKCFENYFFKPMPLSDCAGDIKSKTKYMWRGHTIFKPGDYFYLKDESNIFHNNTDGNSEQKYFSVYIKVAELAPTDAYGLSSVVFSEEDRLRIENMASVALISYRAEMVLISKKWLKQIANEKLIEDIRMNVYQYPSDDVFVNNYITAIKWDEFKINRYQSTLQKLNIFDSKSVK